MCIPIRRRTQMHMSAKHTECTYNYTILPKQKESMFSRCTLTECGQSAKVTNRIVLYSGNLGSLRRQLASQSTSIFIPSQVFGNGVMRMRSTTGHNLWLPMSAYFRTTKKSTSAVYRQVSTRGAQCNAQRHC